MSKQTKAAINLGNETHARGFNDGLNGRPKTIKKTHQHAHRYHIGYRLGQAEARTTRNAALASDDCGIQTHNYRREAIVNPVVQVVSLSGEPTAPGLLTRIWNWMRG